MSTLFKRVVQVPTAMAALALFALMVITFTDVMLRSIFNAPIETRADLTRVLMAVTVFSVMPILSARGGQISVDLLDGFFNRFNLARWRNAMVDLACGVMLIRPTQRVWVLAERSRSYGDVMEYLGLSVHYLGWFIAVMIGITALVLILRGLMWAFAPQLVPSDV
ncbi:TRAP transporter small permease [Jannaschia sp. CCS1]|uniref:TRAP transporter small permease n=1 Tax=Jannaschia sp. (strain CCS1) TaxID=290400 RepID=UPI000053D296|nr:TRAP transporter small permease subunit [Jannaschia sp. CCS1]ABD54256.1 TRAP dicarboxylate transporter DctQ subunit [Jannaschia sp. CCS1]